LAALKQEEKRLQHELSGIQGAIAALNGRRATTAVTRSTQGQPRGSSRTLSAAAKAKISKAAKERWAKIRAEKAKKGK
jgi:hypothetical protein